MLMLQRRYEEAIAQISHILAGAGLDVVRTFDLQSACADRPGGVCPHHGIAPCNCQMTVLLVYADGYAPLALVVHGCDEQTWLSVVDAPQQRPDPELEAAVMRAMTSHRDVLWSKQP